MNIVIIGQGFVGKALKHVLALAHDVRGFDKDSTKSNFERIEEISKETELFFLCLPTPMRESGECDLSIIHSVLQELAQSHSGANVVIKSTIPPGTTDLLNELYNLQIGFSPEFLTERYALEDLLTQDRMIIGSDSEDLKILFSQAFNSIFPRLNIIPCQPKEAEMCKYISNLFFATKIAFANEIYGICESIAANYKQVMKVALTDKRLGDQHWDVPGHDGKLGFGGSCFPKDINALLYAFDGQTDLSILNAVWRKNLLLRPEKDWESLKGRAVSN